jgi:hypothetical protein
MSEYDEQRKTEEWNKLMCFSVHKDIADEKRREEKLKRRKQQMREELDEAKEQLWNHRDDEDFEERSQWIIDRAIKKMKSDAQKEFLKFLYETGRNRKDLDPDRRLQLAKNMIDAVRYEEHHIIVPVDVHIQEIIADLDQRRYEVSCLQNRDFTTKDEKNLV